MDGSSNESLFTALKIDYYFFNLEAVIQSPLPYPSESTIFRAFLLPFVEEERREKKALAIITHCGPQEVRGGIPIQGCHAVAIDPKLLKLFCSCTKLVIFVLNSF